MHGADRALGENEEPSLKQIMVALQGCQNKLIDYFGELKVEFSFLKHDMQKLREKAQATDHRLCCFEGHCQTYEHRHPSD